MGDGSAFLVRMAACLVGWLVLLAGIRKCWSISRRPTTNTKCIMGLMMILIAWLLFAVCPWLLILIPALVLIYGVVAMVSFGITMAAAVLAVVGLQEVSRRRDQYTQGRAQAISTLVLSGLVPTLMI